MTDANVGVGRVNKASTTGKKWYENSVSCNDINFLNLRVTKGLSRTILYLLGANNIKISISRNAYAWRVAGTLYDPSTVLTAEETHCWTQSPLSDATTVFVKTLYARLVL